MRFPRWSIYLETARPELLWGHCSYLNAVLSGDGQRIWQTPYRNNTEVKSLMGVGDSNGDGTVELLASTADGVRLFQATDGAVLLDFDDGVRAHTDVVSGDVDSDGRDEFLFGSGTKLICVEQEEDTLRRAWTLEVRVAAAISPWAMRIGTAFWMRW